jgi:hypothetical protein
LEERTIEYSLIETSTGACVEGADAVAAGAAAGVELVLGAFEQLAQVRTMDGMIR